MNLYYKLKWNIRLEKDFTTAFLKEFKAQWWWSYKISDLARTIKPFDWFGVNSQGVFFCEAKMIDLNVFNFSQIRDNQFTALKRIQELSDKYNMQNIHPIVLVYSVKFKNYKVVHFSEILERMAKWKQQLNFLF